MHRIDADGHVGNLFSDGDPSTGTPGTKVDDDWLNAVQEEIAGTIEAGGVVLAKGTNDQLASVVAPAIVMFGASDLGSTSGRWLFPGYVDSAIDATRRVITVPFDGVIRAIYVHAVTALIGVGGQYSLTVYKNGVAVGLMASLTEGDFDASDTGAIAVSAGDYLEVYVECVSIGTSAKRVTATLAISVG